MTLKVEITDSGGNARSAHVTSIGSLHVSGGEPFLHEAGVPSKLTFASGLLDAVGDGTGSTAMGVNGSSTAVTFRLNSNLEYDIRVMKIVIYLQDGSINHAGFGALSALTNGFDVGVVEAGVTTYVVEKAKSFANLIEQTAAEAPFGDAARAFELDAVLSNEDAMVLPFSLSSVIPGGVRIGRRTADFFFATVNDDLSSLTSLTVRVLGYRHFP